MEEYNLISNYIDKKRSYAARLTKRLVNIPTVNPPGVNYERMVGALEEELERIGFSTRRIVTPKSLIKKRGITEGSPRINLIADWKTKSKKTLHINGHYDVVPAVGVWKNHPFKSILKGDKIYGRGSEDMKGTITAIILAVSALKAAKATPKVNIHISFTPDEEIGGTTGFGWLVKNRKIKADFGLSEGYSDDCVSCGNKGILWMRVTFFGKTAHASIPYKGVNSFDAMLNAGIEFKRLDGRLKKRKTNFNMKRDRDRYSTMVMGGELKGGNKSNVVPHESSFSIDRRLIPEESMDKAKYEIKEILKRCEKRVKGSRFKIEILAEDRAVFVREEGNICKAIAGAVKRIAKKDAKFFLMPGGTDLRYLISRGIPSVGYSARGGESWHSDNEFVYLSSILDTAKVYALTIMNMKG